MAILCDKFPLWLWLVSWYNVKPAVTCQMRYVSFPNNACTLVQYVITTRRLQVFNLLKIIFNHFWNQLMTESIAKSWEPWFSISIKKGVILTRPMYSLIYKALPTRLKLSFTKRRSQLTFCIPRAGWGNCDVQASPRSASSFGREWRNTRTWGKYAPTSPGPVKADNGSGNFGKIFIKNDQKRTVDNYDFV